jgi:hypothetical protein
MKAMISALALVALAASPTFAAHSHAKHLREGRASAVAPRTNDFIIQNGFGHGSDSGYRGTGREQMIHNN